MTYYAIGLMGGLAMGFLLGWVFRPVLGSDTKPHDTDHEHGSAWAAAAAHNELVSVRETLADTEAALHKFQTGYCEVSWRLAKVGIDTEHLLKEDVVHIEQHIREALAAWDAA